MPGSTHRGLIPRATNTRRGEHPDLFGDMQMPDVQMTPNVEDRDLNREMTDPGRRAFLMERVAAAQSLEMDSVQTYLSGQAYPGTFADGLRTYVADRTAAREWAAQMAGKTTYVDDSMIADMSMERYDELFDSAGRPREGTYYHATHGIRLSDQIDPHSGRELFNR